MKYIINGKPVTVDRELTDAEIDEIAADLGGARPTTGPEAIPTGGNPPAPPAQLQMSANERMLNNALMGAAAVPILGAGARGIQLATQGGKAAPYTANLAKALMPQTGRALAAEGTIGAASGLVGGETGQQLAQKFGEGYRTTGEFVGGLGSGMFANTLTRSIPEMAMGAWKAKTGNIVDEISAATGGVRARGKLAQAMEANPTLSDDLLRAKEIEASTGVKLPVTAASKGDTTLTGLVSSQTSRGENASFTAFMANTLTNLIPNVYAALDVVSRELVGALPGVTRDAKADRIASNQTLRIPQAPTNTTSSYTPSMAIPSAIDQTVGNAALTLSKNKYAGFSWTGEEIYAMDQGPGFRVTRAYR